MKVKFNDLKRHHKPFEKEIFDSFKRIMNDCSFIRGKDVFEFEENFADLNQAKYCISCANGTDALYIAIKSLGTQFGDEVIVPAHSWISTSETVTQAGAKVIFCDTTIDTFNINPEKIEEKITKKTVGIIPVHLYGQPAEMSKIMEIAKRHNLWVIEDCAQAHLAKFDNKLVGQYGDAATFSFYPGKNLGAMGDAGAILTNDFDLSQKMQKFARHGGIKKGIHEVEGINSRMDSIQAAILNIKLNHIKEWTNKRKIIAKRYNSLLKDNKKIVTPTINDKCDPVWHLYAIKHEERDRLKQKLEDKGIQTIINYPICLPMLEAYEYLDKNNNNFKNAIYNQSRILSIPLYPEMSIDQQDYVVETINLYS